MSSVLNRGRALLLAIAAGGVLLIASTGAKAAPVTGERALLNRVDANDTESASVRVRVPGQSLAAIDGERALLEPELATGRRSTHETA